MKYNKFISVLLIIFLVLSNINVSFAASNDLLVDYNVDGTGQSRDVGQRPSGWFPYLSQYTYGTCRISDIETPSGDNRCIQVINSNQYSSDCGFRSTAIPAIENYYYTFRLKLMPAYVYYKSVGSGIFINFVNTDTTESVTYSMDFETLSSIYSNLENVNEWTEIEFSKQAPPGYNQVIVGFKMTSKNKSSYYDDVQLFGTSGPMSVISTPVIDSVSWDRLPTFGFFGKIKLRINNQDNIDHFEVYVNDEADAKIPITSSTGFTDYFKTIYHVNDAGYTFKVRAINSYGESSFSNPVYLADLNGSLLFPLLAGNVAVATAFPSGFSASKLLQSKYVLVAGSLLVGLGAIFVDAVSLTDTVLDFLASLSISDWEMYKKSVDLSEGNSISLNDTLTYSAKQYVDKIILSNSSSVPLPSSALSLPQSISPNWEFGKDVSVPEPKLIPPISIPIPRQAADILNKDISLAPDIPVTEDLSLPHIYPDATTYVPDLSTADGSIIGLLKSLLDYLRIGIQGILDFILNFFDKLKELLLFVFVPDATVFLDFFNELYDLLHDKFAGVYYAIDQITILKDTNFINDEFEGFYIDLNFPVQGHFNIVSAAPWITIASKVRNFFKAFFWIFIAMYVIKKVAAVLSGQGGK